MIQYLHLLKKVLSDGIMKEDRTGVGTFSIFGHQMRFCLNDGFPLLTTKKIHLKSVIYELLWFLRGNSNVKYLNQHGIHIWDKWANNNGDLGPIYGVQWRSWNGHIDQIKKVIDTILKDPNSRRMIVNSWNVEDINRMKLPPCHCFFQFYVVKKKLSLHLYQRSADIFLGLPFNIASYALLLKMVSHVTCLEEGDFIHTLGDAHIYLNHLEQVKLQCSRSPKPLPYIKLNPKVKNIFDFKYEDFIIDNYHPYANIRGEIAV